MNAKRPRPPRIAEWLLRVAVPSGVSGRSMMGDAREEYLEDLQTGSGLRARLRYWRHVLSIVVRFAGRTPPEPANARRDRVGWDTRIGNALFDVKLAARLLRKRPGLTLAAVISLGLGIGANTAIFSLVNSILLRPLPYPEPEQLVVAFRIDPEVTGPNPTPSRLNNLYAVPYEVHLDWVEMSPVFQAAGAYAGTGYTLQGEEGPRRVSAVRMTSGVFASLAVPPQLGRYFLPEDDLVGAPLVAVLSHPFWQSRYGEDLDVIGEQIVLDEVSHTIVGVMPAGFGYPDRMQEMWTSFDDARKTSSIRNGGYLQVLARLKTDYPLEQAQLEMDAVARRIGEAHPEEVEHGIGLFPRKALVVADSRGGLLMLMGAVGLVLLIACTNIASLFLVRATERRKEIGVRQALGAGRGRVLFQHMSEAVLLSLLGGAVGLGLAVVGLEPFLTLLPGDLPRIGEIGLDMGMLGFAAGFAVLTGVLTGALPAARASATPIADVLQEDGRSFVGSRKRNRTQAALVVSEVALAFVLLAGAGLFVRSLARLMAVDTGITTENVAATRIVVPPNLRDSWDVANGYFRDIEERILALPGVESVGRANQMPLLGGWSTPPVSVETSEGIWDGVLHFSTVTPGYFSAVGIPVVTGRALLEDDMADSEPVIVVSEALARQTWPDEDPIGRRIRLDSQGDSIWRTVVGVMGDVRYRLNFDPMLMFYVPHAQRPVGFHYLVIKAGVDPVGLFPAIRQAVAELDPETPVTIRELDRVIEGSSVVAGSRFVILVLGSLSALAALLAAVGVYGVLAYTVQQRSREIGIQLALGAEKGRVLAGVMSRGLLLAGIGLVAGGGITIAAGRVVNAQLFEVQAFDPLTLGAVAVLVAITAAAASYLPARRAACLDPAEVLRAE